MTVFMPGALFTTDMVGVPALAALDMNRPATMASAACLIFIPVPGCARAITQSRVSALRFSRLVDLVSAMNEINQLSKIVDTHCPKILDSHDC